MLPEACLTGTTRRNGRRLRRGFRRLAVVWSRFKVRGRHGRPWERIGGVFNVHQVVGVDFRDDKDGVGLIEHHPHAHANISQAHRHASLYTARPNSDVYVATFPPPYAIVSAVAKGNVWAVLRNGFGLPIVHGKGGLFGDRR